MFTHLHNTSDANFAVPKSASNTPKKRPSDKFPNKRRSISSQFRKDEKEAKKSAKAKAANQSLHKKVLCKSSKQDKQPVSKKIASPSRKAQEVTERLTSKQVTRNRHRDKSNPRSESRKTGTPETKKKLSKTSAINRESRRRSYENRRRSLKKESAASPMFENSFKEVDCSEVRESKSEVFTNKTSTPEYEPSINNQNTKHDEQDGCTPKPEQKQAVDSATVVKTKTLDNSQGNNGSFFESLYPEQNSENTSENRKNSSLVRRGKLFPDLDELSPQLRSQTNLDEEIQTTETNNLDKLTAESVDQLSNLPSTPQAKRLSCYERMIGAAERSFSPARRLTSLSPGFRPLSPHALPTQPSPTHPANPHPSVM